MPHSHAVEPGDALSDFTAVQVAPVGLADTATPMWPYHARNPGTQRRCLMRIGFIGLGNMGGPMALNVLKGGHTVVVNDIRRDAAAPHLRQGATWADTPKAVA